MTIINNNMTTNPAAAKKLSKHPIILRLATLWRSRVTAGILLGLLLLLVLLPKAATRLQDAWLARKVNHALRATKQDAALDNPNNSHSSIIDTTTNFNNHLPSIPAKIHLIHISLALPPHRQPSIPQDVQANVQAWNDLHPTWQVKVWNNSAVHEEFPTLIPVLELLQPMAWVADVLRYLILHKYGGFYFDTDIMPFRSIEPFRRNNITAWGVCERPTARNVSTQRAQLSDFIMTPGTCRRLCNAVIAAVPQHPALQSMAVEALQNTAQAVQRHKKFTVLLTGPPLWTRHVKEQQVTVFEAGTFFPCDFRDVSKCVPERFQNNPNVYGMHMWKNSWH